MMMKMWLNHENAEQKLESQCYNGMSHWNLLEAKTCWLLRRESECTLWFQTTYCEIHVWAGGLWNEQDQYRTEETRQKSTFLKTKWSDENRNIQTAAKRHYISPTKRPALNWGTYQGLLIRDEFTWLWEVQQRAGIQVFTIFLRHRTAMLTNDEFHHHPFK